MFHIAKCNTSLNQAVTEERLSKISQDYSLGLFFLKKKNMYLLLSSALKKYIFGLKLDIGEKMSFVRNLKCHFIIKHLQNSEHQEKLNHSYILLLHSAVFCCSIFSSNTSSFVGLSCCLYLETAKAGECWENARWK